MNRTLKPYILLLPMLFVMIGIFASGILMGTLQSFGYFPAMDMSDITIKYYKEILMSKAFLASMSFSIYISFVSSLLSIILGVVMAYALVVNSSKKGFVMLLYKLPIVVPYTVAVMLVYNILSQNGILPRVLNVFGLKHNNNIFQSIFFSSNGIGIILTYMWKEIPFVAMVVYGVLSNISGRLSDVALNLGANKRQVFLHVLLPLSIPSVITAFIIIFSYSFGAFEIPYLLGATFPKALPVSAYIEYINIDLSNRPYAMVYNIMLMLISLISIWIIQKVIKIAFRCRR